MGLCARGRPVSIRVALLLSIPLAALACGGDGGVTSSAVTAPSPPAVTAPSAPAAIELPGTVVSVFDGAALAGAQIGGPNLSHAVSAGDGSFILQAPASSIYRATITAPGFVQRVMSLRVPGPAAHVSLIPEAFDLVAFDQFARASNGRLQRWRDAPTLVIERAVLALADAGTNANAFRATADLMTETDALQLRLDLEWGLPLLTGEQFQRFRTVRVQAAAPDSSVGVFQGEEIHVARYRGLRTERGILGFARWGWLSDGTVVLGSIGLDADWDSLAHAVRRSVRVHELGHALGYMHVTVRPSVMQPSAGQEPTAFDRQAARIVFLRPPGNRSPDVDPEGLPTNQLLRDGGGPVTIGPLVP